MDTRVLTLFDDEDFLPQEELPKKSKKEAAAKEPASKTTAPQQELPQTHPENEVNHSAELIAEETTTTSGTDQMTDIIDEPKNAVPEVIADTIENVTSSEDEQPEEEELLLHIENDLQGRESDNTEQAVADEELNKQILSELIQTDYTALIHRDYPFEVNHAEVIQKKKPGPEEKQNEAEETIDEADDTEVFEDVVPLPDWNLDKKYYSIGEVATLFAVNTSHIRFWTNEFKIKPRTTRKGDRLYSPKDIAELRLIHHLVKEKKHTIKGAKEKLKAGKDNVSNKLDLKDSLQGLRDTLLQIRAQL